MLAANDIINELVKSDFSRESYQAAKVTSNRFFSVHLNKTNHTLHCMGHCHIDTGLKFSSIDLNYFLII